MSAEGDTHITIAHFTSYVRITVLDENRAQLLLVEGSPRVSLRALEDLLRERSDALTARGQL